MKKAIFGFILVVVGLFLFIAGTATVAFAEQIELKWDDPSAQQIDGFRLYQRIGTAAYDYNSPMVIPNVSDGDGNIPADVPRSAILDITVQPGEVLDYYWVVRVYSGPIQSQNSAEITYKFDRSFPPAPSGFAGAFDYASNSITLGWNQADSDIVKYWQVFASLTSGGPYELVGRVDNTGQTGPTITDPLTIAPDGQLTTVYFTLVAFRDAETYSPNATEIAIDVDRRTLEPPTLEITVIVPVQ